MKKFAFISDFDGTLTDIDFYRIVMKRFPENKGRVVLDSWRRGEIGVYEFLYTVFSTIKRSEDEIYSVMLEIPFDRYAKGFIESVMKSGGDFFILSAGAGYYIEKMLKYYEISGVTVISNKSEFRDGGIYMTADKNSPYYSEKYGIDKSLAVEHYKKEYEKIYYAGDSEPDLKASLKADLVFARAELQGYLKKLEHPFIPYDNFGQIGSYLKEMGVIQYEDSLA